MNRSGSLIGMSACSTKVPDFGAWGTLRSLSSQRSDSGALLHQTARSASRNGTHRIDTDDDRRSGVERQLIADLTGPEQVTEERPFAVREADVDPARIELDGGDVVVAAVDAEAAPQFVHRHVRAALDEAPELGRRALAVALGVC